MPFTDRPIFRAAVFLIGAISLVGESALALEAFPPSPYDILRSTELETPYLEAVEACRPQDLDAAIDPVVDLARGGAFAEARSLLADWSEGQTHADEKIIVFDAVLQAREAEGRDALLATIGSLRETLTRDDLAQNRFCLRLELARILLLLDRASEAAAQLTVAERESEKQNFLGRSLEAIAFMRAEVLYDRGLRFDAHLAYRKIAKEADPRLAAAARMRLTDLSFDAGKVDQVSREYEALLPRANAFGGDARDWALRAAEAALDAGEASRSLRWIEFFLDSDPDVDARDAAQIRLADLDVHFDDPLSARKRLKTVSGRRQGDRLGAVAAVRGIDMGIAAGSPDQRVEVLLRVVREHRRGVRRYALGVLMRELDQRGDLDGALAVATRLAYEGVDPVVTPRFEADLARILGHVTESFTQVSCGEIIRMLGGRYGILIERSERPDPFEKVGLCFEELELPWLAVGVYRTITRRFGTQGTSGITLPLARSSLATGETALARRVAEAALEEPDEDEQAWRAVLAEANFVEGRFEEASTSMRKILDAPNIGAARGKLARMLALSLSRPESSAASITAPDPTLGFLARRLPDWLAAKEVAPRARENLIEAAILTAHAHRRAGRPNGAAKLYQLVNRYAEPGAMRSSARFWIGLQQAGSAAEDSVWGEDPNVELGSPWARVALLERALWPLIDSYGAVIR